MGKEYEFKDATKPLTIHVTDADIRKAIAEKGQGVAHRCVIAQAIRREYRCFDIQILRTVAYVRRKENMIPDRYEISESAKDLLIAWDAAGRAWPITVTLKPPKPAMRVAYRRTEKARAMAKKSYERRRKQQMEKGEGKRRAYTKPSPLTLFGVRNGTGVRPGSTKLSDKRGE